ncbi:mucin-binding lectin 1 [Russula earlei]|uniref:Mucin-binding lectin 1 n=1 Tax=Russula earlei TaxID=71964 RepID=A0ACC0U893_9AGAM|nr:mucin-binding lectin 1 [Russula earlei]
MAIFVNGQSVNVTTWGPGHLYLYTGGSNVGAPSCVGGTATTNEGITRYIISFSHNFTKFAFYWAGQGEAVYHIDNHLVQEASREKLEGGELHPSALARDEETTVFVVHDKN